MLSQGVSGEKMPLNSHMVNNKHPPALSNVINIEN